jgi:hypothetical protein
MAQHMFSDEALQRFKFFQQASARPAPGKGALGALDAKLWGRADDEVASNPRRTEILTGK